MVNLNVQTYDIVREQPSLDYTKKIPTSCKGCQYDPTYEQLRDSKAPVCNSPKNCVGLSQYKAVKSSCGKKFDKYEAV